MEYFFLDDIEFEPEPEPTPDAEHSSLASMLNQGEDDQYYGFEDDY